MGVLIKSRIAMKHCAVTKNIRFNNLPIMQMLVCHYKLWSIVNLESRSPFKFCMYAYTFAYKGTIGPIEDDASCSISLGNIQCREEDRPNAAASHNDLQQLVIRKEMCKMK